MKKLPGILLKCLGVVLILILLSGYGFYTYLFEHEHQYYEVEDPHVKANLDKWQDQKFGLFMHWGTYSQQGIVESWALCGEDEPWCRRKHDNYVEFKKEYEDLKLTFNPTAFDPQKWAAAANDAGMKYLVFTAKHHDGFCMFDTETTDYKITSPDCPFSQHPKANITKEVFNAFRAEDFMIGAYFSKPDWNSGYFWWPYFPAPDRNVNYKIEKHPERWQKYVEFAHTQVDELMSNYGKIDILWLDGGWVRPLAPIEATISNFVDGIFSDVGYTQLNIPQNQDMDMAGMAAMARKKQPGLIMVDRFVEGREENYLTPENYIPDDYDPRPWESCITMAGGWSYSPDAQYKPARQLIHSLVDIVSKNGSLLLNVGPGPDGTWQDEVYERLEEIGAWMKVNGAAIYKTNGRKHFKEGKVSFTVSKDGSVNAIYLADEDEESPPSEILIEGVKPNKNTRVKMYGHGTVEWEKVKGGIKVLIPQEIQKNPPCEYAWGFNITGLK
jgi:alpha-L-fucosidase